MRVRRRGGKGEMGGKRRGGASGWEGREGRRGRVGEEEEEGGDRRGKEEEGRDILNSLSQGPVTHKLFLGAREEEKGERGEPSKCTLGIAAPQEVEEIYLFLIAGDHSTCCRRLWIDIALIEFLYLLGFIMARDHSYSIGKHLHGTRIASLALGTLVLVICNEKCSDTNTLSC
jgi:hypothetical protein